MDIEFTSDIECRNYISALMCESACDKLLALFARNDMDPNMHIDGRPLLVQCVRTGCLEVFDELISRPDLVWSTELVLGLYDLGHHECLRKITDLIGIPFPHVLDVKAGETKRVYVPWRNGSSVMMYGGFASLTDRWSYGRKVTDTLLVKYDDGDVREYNIATKRMIDDKDLAVINDYLNLQSHDFVDLTRCPRNKSADCNAVSSFSCPCA